VKTVFSVAESIDFLEESAERADPNGGLEKRSLTENLLAYDSGNNGVELYLRRQQSDAILDQLAEQTTEILTLLLKIFRDTDRLFGGGIDFGFVRDGAPQPRRPLSASHRQSLHSVPPDGKPRPDRPIDIYPRSDAPTVAGEADEGPQVPSRT